MADKKSLIVPLALAAAGAVVPAPPRPAPSKVLRVLARSEQALGRAQAGGGASPVVVTSQGLGNIIHVIGGAG